MCVWHSEKGRNYSLALHFALSASLLICVFNNSGANAELQISSRKNLINWPSSQASCQSLGLTCQRFPQNSKQQCAIRHRAEKQNKRSRAEHCIKIKLPSINRALQSGQNLPSWLLLTAQWLTQPGSHHLAFSAISQSVSLKLEVNIPLWGFSGSQTTIMALLGLAKSE